MTPIRPRAGSVVVRRENTALAVPDLHAAQRAFCAGGLDVADPVVLAKQAASFGGEPHPAAAAAALRTFSTHRELRVCRRTAAAGGA